MWFMSTSCNRPGEPKPPFEEVAPEPITVKTSLFTGLLQTEFIKIGVDSGLETRFSSI
jgi:hypothetical protein